jgi:hypothetical protein
MLIVDRSSQMAFVIGFTILRIDARQRSTYLAPNGSRLMQIMLWPDGSR